MLLLAYDDSSAAPTAELLTQAARQKTARAAPPHRRTAAPPHRRTAAVRRSPLLAWAGLPTLRAHPALPVQAGLLNAAILRSQKQAQAPMLPMMLRMLQWAQASHPRPQLLAPPARAALSPCPALPPSLRPPPPPRCTPALLHPRPLPRRGPRRRRHAALRSPEWSGVESTLSHPTCTMAPHLQAELQEREPLPFPQIEDLVEASGRGGSSRTRSSSSTVVMQ